MIFNDGRQDTLNQAHAIAPCVGDYWHEMFCPIRVVLAVTRETVTFCDKVLSVDDHRWTWDLTQTKRVIKDEFANELHYQSESMKDKFHCDVVPGGHMDIVDYWKADVVGTEHITSAKE